MIFTTYTAAAASLLHHVLDLDTTEMNINSARFRRQLSIVR